MAHAKSSQPDLPAAALLRPAQPLWRLAPTRAPDGRCLADFMMLIPGLGSRSELSRARVTALIREVCESYGEQVAFADINYRLNVLWVSVAAEPGLAGCVAHSIRGRVPEALLVGGQLGAVGSLAAADQPRRAGFWRRLWRLSRRATLCLGGGRRD